MRRSPWLALLALLAGCPPPAIGDGCERLLVEADGTLNLGVGGGPAASGSAHRLGVVGTPLTLTVFAPLTSCVSDTLRADPRVLDPGEGAVPFQLEGGAVPSGVEGAVKATLTFTPTRPGLHTLQLAFEPSLGVRSLLVDVAADGLAGAVTRLAIPADLRCPRATFWALTDDTFACEEPGQIAIVSADGGTTRFEGEQLVVVDTVLWSLHTPSSALERRVFADGGLLLTNTFPDFSARPAPGMHDLNLAWRFHTNDRLALVRIEPGGATVREWGEELLFGAPRGYLVEDDDTVCRWGDPACLVPGCVSAPDIVAMDPGLVWRGLPGAPQASGGFARPVRDLEAPARFTLWSPRLSVASPATGFERIPLWLSPEGESGHQVLVSTQAGTLTFTAWPRGQVLRVGRRQVLLGDDAPDFIRIVGR